MKFIKEIFKEKMYTSSQLFCVLLALLISSKSSDSLIIQLAVFLVVDGLLLAIDCVIAQKIKD